MNSLPVLAALGLLCLALGIVTAIVAKKKPKVLLKLLTFLLVILAGLLLIGAIALFPSDLLAGVDELWSWLTKGGTQARRFVAMLWSA